MKLIHGSGQWLTQVGAVCWVEVLEDGLATEGGAVQCLEMRLYFHLDL